MNDDVFASTYENLGYCTIEPFEIITTTETPIVVPPYRKSFHERELINDEVKKMLESDIITVSNSRWSAPVVLIPKPDKTVRFCVDYRKLNKVTVQDPYPLPRVDDILMVVATAVI